MELLQITSYAAIDRRRLMDVYRESNTENVDEFYPEALDKVAMLEKLEADFLHFIETDFLAKEGNSYWILEEGGVWRSALRLYRVSEELYYIEALETRPDSRRRGYAAQLLGGVIEELKKRGPFRLCDCVSKKNEPSLRTHQSCGFEIVSDAGMDYLRSKPNDRNYGMEYRCGAVGRGN